jgi:non-ribosomal peptide synthase protein (TIGR01720 family)
MGRQRAYWQGVERQLQSLRAKDSLRDVAGPGISRVASFTLTAAYTNRLLTTARVPFNTELNDLLLAALVLAMEQETGDDTLALMLEGHGRELILPELNISRTVGWFSCEYPVILQARGDLALHIKTIKETLRRVPDKGIGYGILKYVSGDNVISGLQPSLRFNFFGEARIDSDDLRITIDPLVVANTESPRMHRQYAVEVKGAIQDGQLSITIDVATGVQLATSADDLATAYEHALITIIDYCTSREGAQLTPADLTYKELSFEDLDTLGDIFK